MLKLINLKSLNPHITCVLCGGYLVDATTIIECLHSFCRSCIIECLESSYHCPVCKTEVHKTRPILNLRPDRVLQDIVYKLVPGFNREYGRNNNGRNEAYKNGKYCIKDPVCITLEYYGTNWKNKSVFPRRYLRCSSQVTVKVLKKFVLTKFGIPTSHAAEIVRCDEILTDDLTIDEISRIYGLYTKPHIDLQYIFISKDDHCQHPQQHKLQRGKQLKPQRQIEQHQNNKQQQARQRITTKKLKRPPRRPQKEIESLPLTHMDLKKRKNKLHLDVAFESKEEILKDYELDVPSCTLTPDSDHQDPLPSVFMNSCY